MDFRPNFFFQGFAMNSFPPPKGLSASPLIGQPCPQPGPQTGPEKPAKTNRENGSHCSIPQLAKEKQLETLRHCMSARENIFDRDGVENITAALVDSAPTSRLPVPQIPNDKALDAEPSIASFLKCMLIGGGRVNASVLGLAGRLPSFLGCSFCLKRKKDILTGSGWQRILENL
jgi:hypothetical protein